MLILPLLTNNPKKNSQTNAKLLYNYNNFEKCSKFPKKMFLKFFKFTWKVRNWLNRKKYQISDFYFSSYGHFCDFITQFLWNFAIARKIIIGVFLNYFPILFSTFGIFHKVYTTSEGGGGQHILKWEKAPIFNKNRDQLKKRDHFLKLYNILRGN